MATSNSQRCDYWWEDNVKFGLSVVTPPTAEPVTVEEVKDNCHVTASAQDNWFYRKIQEARELAETFVKRRFVTTELRLSLDRFPPSVFYMPSPPLIDVTSLKYLDTSGVLQTLDETAYTVDTYTEPGRITPAYSTSWPNYRQDINSIEVIYNAGYGSPDDVPPAIKGAIVMTVTQWNENRGDEADKETTNLPRAAKALLRSVRLGIPAMSLNLTITMTSVTPSGPVSRSKKYTGSGLVEVSETVPDGDDFLINAAVDMSEVIAFYLSSDQDVMVETNDAGSPDDVLNLIANVPYVWTEDSYNTFLITADVTALYVTNDTGESANVELRVLQDATP